MKRINLRQPVESVDAWQTAADRTHNGNLSAWIFDACNAALPNQKLKKQASVKRKPKGKPSKGEK